MYSYIGEFAGLIMAVLLLLVMLYTKPKKTYVFKYIFYGVICSIFSIIINISIAFVANHPEEYYNRYIFMGQLIVFLLLYNIILFCIFSYVNMMSIVRRGQRKEFMMMYLLLTAVYLTGVVIELAATGLYQITLDGIRIDNFTRFYTSAGIVCAVFCLNATITNRNNVSRVISRAVYILVPIDFIFLVAQLFVVGEFNVIFTAMTYVLPFTLGYMLFHSYPYDEVTGAQSIYALNAYLHKTIGKSNSYMVYVKLLYPEIDNLVAERDDIMFKGVKCCRSIEAISPKVKIYRIAEAKYVNVLDSEDEHEFSRFVNQLRGVFDSLKAELPVPINYIMIAGRLQPEFDEPQKVRLFFEYILKRFKDQNSSHAYIVQPSDYDSFIENHEITTALKDIRNKLDLDDERVVVYAQPIYSVETGSFRVAEALTRIKLGDRMINPDAFIPVAEESGTIHALTCIVLNKVCKVIESIEDYYDFDAISVNISSKEISQPNAHTELFDIISRYDIDLSKIRLELTESAMFESYDVANENMNYLAKAGIHFYLDDFGTGYSSLDRVMDCPFKTIKFDKSLLYKSLDDDRMNDIMTYMIEVFKKNGFVTLVEGVEDESQSQYSMEHGFEYIQGYHYAKPGPIEDVKKYFNRKSSF